MGIDVLPLRSTDAMRESTKHLLRFLLTGPGLLEPGQVPAAAGNAQWDGRAAGLHESGARSARAQPPEERLPISA